MPWLHVARTGVTALVLHPSRSIATVVCLVAVLVPYIAGLGVAAGLARDAAVSLDAGADLYVTGRKFGRGVPLPRSSVEQIAELPGVAAVVPRVVGPIVLGREQHWAVVVGLAPEYMPPEADIQPGGWQPRRPSRPCSEGSGRRSKHVPRNGMISQNATASVAAPGTSRSAREWPLRRTPCGTAARPQLRDKPARRPPRRLSSRVDPMPTAPRRMPWHPLASVNSCLTDH